MSESFSAILRAEADHIWRRIFNHPFLTEVKRGALPLEKFRYYLTQDYLYLEGFARAVAFALARAPDSRTLELLSHRVLTPIERPLHQELMPLVDLSPEDSDRMGRAPQILLTSTTSSERRLLADLAPRRPPCFPVPGVTILIPNPPKDGLGDSP